MTDCEHQILEKCGFEAYDCKECGVELTASRIGVMKMFVAINKRLDKLVNQESVHVTIEDKLPMETYENPSEVPVSSMTYFTELTNCTIMAVSESGLAYQVIKDGFFTWLAKSHVEESAIPLPLGILIPNIPLRKDRQWILGKGKDGKPKLEWKVVGG